MAEGTEDSGNNYEQLFQGDEWELPIDMAIAYLAASNIRMRMEKAGWPDEELMFVDVAIDEAIKNALIHGSIAIGMIPEEKSKVEAVREKLVAEVPANPVHVSVFVSPDEARIRIRDDGDGFDRKTVPDPTLPENILKNKGRGIYFMEKGFDTVEYNEKGNEVTLTKKRKASSAVSSAENG